MACPPTALPPHLLTPTALAPPPDPALATSCPRKAPRLTERYKREGGGSGREADDDDGEVGREPGGATEDDEVGAFSWWQSLRLSTASSAAYSWKGQRRVSSSGNSSKHALKSSPTSGAEQKHGIN